MIAAEPEIRRLTAAEARGQLDALARVLHAVVAGGASVGYLAPFSPDDARAAFEDFVADAERGGRIILAAFLGGELVGAVHVVLALPPNQPHRGEIAKLQVHPDARKLRRELHGVPTMKRSYASAGTAKVSAASRPGTRTAAGPGSARTPGRGRSCPPRRRRRDG